MLFKNVTLQKALEVISGTGKNGKPYTIQEFVLGIPTNSQYGQSIKVKVMREEILSQMRSIKIGQAFNAYIDFEAREYQGKHYQDCNLWRIEFTAPVVETATTTPAEKAQQYINSGAVASAPESDDLPF